MELGLHRPRAAVLAELARGQARMTTLFGAARSAVLVPPWNRIAPALVPALSGLGFNGLSTLGPRPSAEPAPGLRQVNCHLDIMRWKPSRGFLGQEAALDVLAGHLRARREGAADRSEPTGLLTHHLAHDEACWGFLDDLLGRLVGHAAVRFPSVAGAFADPVAAASGAPGVP